MLATPGDLPVGPEWVYEVEWDGLRVLAEVVDGRLHLVTPEGHDVTACFPELAALTHVVPDVVLDGTIVLLSAGVPDATALEARLRGAPPGQHATLMLSDVLRLYGVPLLDRTHDERRATLERLDLRRAAGVGRAVNQSLVISLVGVYAFNYAFTAVLLATHPELQTIR